MIVEPHDVIEESDSLKSSQKTYFRVLFGQKIFFSTKKFKENIRVYFQEIVISVFGPVV